MTSTTITHASGVTTVRIHDADVIGSVADQIAANVAWLTEAVAKGQTDPINLTDTVEVIGDRGETLTVAREIVEVGGFRRCESCDLYVVPSVNGFENCYGFYCDLDSYPCHREC